MLKKSENLSHCLCITLLLANNRILFMWPCVPHTPLNTVLCTLILHTRQSSHYHEILVMKLNLNWLADISSYLCTWFKCSPRPQLAPKLALLGSSDDYTSDILLISSPKRLASHYWNIDFVLCRFSLSPLRRALLISVMICITSKHHSTLLISIFNKLTTYTWCEI